MKTQDLKTYMVNVGTCLPGKALKRLRKVNGIGCTIRSFLYDNDQVIVAVTDRDDTKVDSIICNPALDPTDTTGLKFLPIQEKYKPVIQKLRTQISALFEDYGFDEIDVILDEKDVTPDVLLMDFLYRPPEQIWIEGGREGCQ